MYCHALFTQENKKKKRMKMPSAECAKDKVLRETFRSMDAFHLTWETETDRLKCIYTAPRPGQLRIGPGL